MSMHSSFYGRSSQKAKKSVKSASGRSDILSMSALDFTVRPMIDINSKLNVLTNC